MRTVFVFPLFLVLLSGCQAFTPPVSQSEIGQGNRWFKYNSDYRGAVAIGKESKLTYCAEASPDSARSFKLDLSADLAKPDASTIGAAANYADAIVQLSTRSQSLLVVREAFYRLCERAIANAMSDTDYNTNFKAVLTTAEALFKVELTKAEAAKTQAEAARIQSINEAARTTNMDQSTLQFLLTR